MAASSPQEKSSSVGSEHELESSALPMEPLSLKLTESASKSMEHDAIDLFFTQMGRFPDNPLELADFSLTTELMDAMDVKKATRVYRQRVAADRGYDTPVDTTEAEDALAEYFLLAESSSAIVKWPATLSSMLEAPMEDEKAELPSVLPPPTSLWSLCDTSTDSLATLFCADSSLPPSSASRAPVCAKFHLPLGEFIEQKCGDHSDSGKHYRLGLLLFVERFGVSKMHVLEAIKRVVHATDELSVKRALVNLVRIWYAKYSEDFKGDAEMKRGRAEVIKLFPAIASAETMKETIFSKTSTPPLTQESRWKNAHSGEWMPIARRRALDTLPPTYLCTNDRVVVKHKMKKASDGKKSKKSTVRRLSKSAFRKTAVVKKLRGKPISHVETITWRSQMPLWIVDTSETGESSDGGSVDFDDLDAMSSDSRLTVSKSLKHKSARSSAKTYPFYAKSLPAIADMKLPISSRRCRKRKGQPLSATDLAHVALDVAKDEWHWRWPYLTLYFRHVFPTNVSCLDLSPAHVAEALTLLKFDILARVQPREFANRGWTGVGSKHFAANVRSLIAMFETEAKWAQMSLICCKLTTRAFKLKRLLKVAMECLKHGNVDSACAIRAGIFKKHIAALPMQALPAKYHSFLRRLLALDDSKHIAAKQLAKQRLAEGSAVVPLIAVHLDKLHRIEEAWKPVDACGNVHLRWLKAMHRAVADVCSAQRTAFELAERRDIQLLLIEELKRYSQVPTEDIVAAAELRVSELSSAKSLRRQRTKMSDYVKL